MLYQIDYTWKIIHIAPTATWAVYYVRCWSVSDLRSRAGRAFTSSLSSTTTIFNTCCADAPYSSRTYIRSSEMASGPGREPFAESEPEEKAGDSLWAAYLDSVESEDTALEVWAKESSLGHITFVRAECKMPQIVLMSYYRSAHLLGRSRSLLTRAGYSPMKRKSKLR